MAGMGSPSLRTRRPGHARALFLVAIDLAALAAGWTGCSGTVARVSSGAGGSAMGGAASSGTVAVAVGTGGGATGGTGGTGIGAGGTGGFPPTDDDCGCCLQGQKICGGVCADPDDPMYGCSPTGCAPCSMEYPNAMQVCLNGACALGECDNGFKNCNGDDADGCEANIMADPANCGACGAVCNFAHAMPSCVMGSCSFLMCDPGWAHCNDLDNPCETNLEDDPINCGACGNVCPAAPGSIGVCNGGVCAPVCDAGACSAEAGDGG